MKTIATKIESIKKAYETYEIHYNMVDEMLDEYCDKVANAPEVKADRSNLKEYIEATSMGDEWHAAKENAIEIRDKAEREFKRGVKALGLMMGFDIKVNRKSCLYEYKNIFRDLCMKYNVMVEALEGRKCLFDIYDKTLKWNNTIDRVEVTFD